ncbi:MAG: hypothetical protein QW564_03970 [Sulfolobales archaeon]
MSSSARLGGCEVSIGIGVFESVVRIKDLRGWAWVGYLIKNPTDRRLIIKNSGIIASTIPLLPKVMVFLYGPILESEVARMWEDVDATFMRNNLVSLGSPIPGLKPLSEVVLEGGDKAVLWVYLEDEYVGEVYVLLTIEVAEG